MPVCPVCENAQPAGEACEVCGRPFAPAAVRPAEVIPVEGLEPTGHAPAPALPGDRLAELEATAVEPAGSPLPEEPVAGFEATHVQPVPDPAPEPIEIDPTSAPPAGDVGAALGPGICRSCRTRATGSERFCLACGTRLPRAPVQRGAAVRADPPICAGCGLPLAGARCAACGTRG